MKKEPRPYQRKCLDALYQYWASEDSGNGVIVIPTGGGKSLVMAMLVQELCERWPGTRILILSHVKELISQDHDEILSFWPEAPIGIFSAGIGRKELQAQVLVAGIQSIDKHAHKLNPPPEIAIVDECFTGETKISTPSGEMRVDKMRPGDIVYNAIGEGVVEGISVKQSDELYLVRFSNGEIVQCTGSHPFFTEQGWIKARDLERGQNLFSRKKMQVLWEDFLSVDCNGGRESKISFQGIALAKARMLLAILREETEKPNVKSRDGEKSIGYIKTNRTPPHNSRRERPSYSPANIDSIYSFFGLDCRVCDTNKTKKIGSCVSDVLQGGRGKPTIENSDRVRWRLASWLKKIVGSKKRQFFEDVRVESVSLVERKGNGRVYNLQVSGHPSYYAGGVLVHNCHLIPRNDTTRYRKVLKTLAQMYPHMKCVGLSATPYRLDSGWLHTGRDAIFDRIVYEVSVQSLIDHGYLCPVVPYGSTVKIDTSAVHHSGREFVASELEDAAMAGDITELAVSDMVERAKDRKKWLVFAVGKKHAEQIGQALTRHGITSAIITAETPKASRDEIIDIYKNNSGLEPIRALININVLTTGFNVPAIDMIAMLRPTESCGLYVQSVGRGMRMAPGKENCLVLDYAGNTIRHGPIDDVHPEAQWEGNGSGIAPVKECPGCYALVLAAVRVCPYCGFEFPKVEVKIEATPAQAPLLKSQEPPAAPEELDVESTEWRIHLKLDKPASVCVTYHCGLQDVREWVFPEAGTQHGQYFYGKFCREIGLEYPFPSTARDFLQNILPQARKIWTVRDGKWDRVKGHEWIIKEKIIDDIVPF